MAISSDPQLGNLVTVHGPSYIRLLAKFAVALFLLVLTFTASSVAQWWIVFVLFTLPYMVILPIIRLARYPKIEVYENGLRAAKMTLYWREIDAISMTFMYEIVTVGDFHIGEMRIFKNNEKVLTINYDYARTEKLFAVIEAETAEILWPAYLSELGSKGAIQIGPITLTPQQVTAGRQRVDLLEIENMYFWFNQLRISKHKGILGGITVALVATVAYIKNYHLLMPLIQLLAENARIAQQVPSTSPDPAVVTTTGPR